MLLKHWRLQCFFLQNFILDLPPILLYDRPLGDLTYFHGPEQPPFMLMVPTSTLSRSKISLDSYFKCLLDILAAVQSQYAAKQIHYLSTHPNI